MKRDIFSRSALGIMFLNKKEVHRDYNRSTGIDSTTSMSMRNSRSLWLVQEHIRRERKGKRNNFVENTGLRFKSDLLQYNLSFLNIDKDFIPVMSFVKRTDIKSTEGGVTLSPRLNNQTIRQVFFITNTNYITDHSNRVLNKTLSGTFFMDFENTTNFSITVDREFEYFDKNFEIRDRV